MNILNLLSSPSHETEIDAAVWIDDQTWLRPIAGFLAHHRTVRAVTTAAIGMALAPVAAVITTANTVGRVIDQAHAVAGEGTAPCAPCVTAEADAFADDDSELTVAEMVDAWDLKDGGL